MKQKRLFALLTSVLAIVFVTSTVTAAPLAQTGLPEFDPENFAGDVIDNPYFPLVPGTRFVHRGESDGAPTRDVTIVTHKTKEILGVTTTVVHHLNFEEGVLIEDTFDWFAQDKYGNVWYFGEDTKELDEDGNVISTEGSWEARVDGAQPGIIMLADPQVGDSYSQEVAPGVAEDMAEVISFEDSFCVRYGCFEDVLVTREWTPLEPDIVEHKYYAKGVGFIFGIMVEGGEEQTELVRVRNRNGDDDDKEGKDNDGEGRD
ncbi:MAG: hypothetical protein L0287_25005 [Anaerolineae bacterium]|nr:hypothetical protein [Anaerolineae bacterium]MCI0610672.1 hypothetical protein [Anaerolineae bacterium]